MSLPLISSHPPHTTSLTTLLIHCPIFQQQTTLATRHHLSVMLHPQTTIKQLLCTHTLPCTLDVHPLMWREGRLLGSKMSNNECRRGHVLNSYGLFWSPTYLIKVREYRLKCNQGAKNTTHVTNHNFYGMCIKIRWGILAML